MNIRTLHCIVPSIEDARRPVRDVFFVMLVTGLAGAIGWWSTIVPGWVSMWTIATTLFFALKLATLRTHGRTANRPRVLAYLFAWPGMNAAAFLRETATPRPRVTTGELVFACAKLAFGLALTGWALRRVGSAPPLLVGWIGMLGLIFTLHFGVFHLASFVWRAVGVDAPPIMRAPIAARSVAEFWGERWNIAFAESARRLIVRPLAWHCGVARAGALVFVISGLVHEFVISVPARGGWGGPTFYFLLQGAALAFEKSAPGRRLGLEAGGIGARAWTLAVTALPAPLLFHAPFVERVIVPFFEFLKEAL